jgi:putative PIN family toxin of toxin-antitoxin system
VIEVVVDTNVLVAAFRSSLGASFQLLQTIEDQRWRPVISPTLAFEYEAVLKRQDNSAGLSREDVDDFVEYFCSRAKLVQIYFRWRPVLPDPDDDRILEVAVRNQSPIVTFNAKDFVGAETLGISILSPGQLLSQVKRKS